jgi:hypothetical protein
LQSRSEILLGREKSKSPSNSLLFLYEITLRESAIRTLNRISITHGRSIREHGSKWVGFGYGQRSSSCSRRQQANPNRHGAGDMTTRNYSAYLRISTQRDATGGVYHLSLSFRRAAAKRT